MEEGGRYPGRWSRISGYFGRRHSYHGDPTRWEALAIFLNGVPVYSITVQRLAQSMTR